MKSKTSISAIIYTCILCGCSPFLTRYTDFSVERDVDLDFFKCLPPAAPGARVDIYRCQFDEVPIEDDNLIEVTSRNTRSRREKVTYEPQQRAWRELYLFKYPDSLQWYDTNYVYFTAKFKYMSRKKKKDKGIRMVCLGLGPSYFGKGVFRGNNSVIEFEKDLKVHKENDKYFLCSKKKGESERIRFVIPYPYDSSEARMVSRIVYHNRNKIGGTKHLVYAVDSVFHDPRALEFLYKKSL